MDRTVTPTIGNLAWSPLPSTDSIEIIDRFNGVPTLGVLTSLGSDHLFWRVAGYTTDHVSCWLYVPLSATESAGIDDEGTGPDFLTGLVFEAPRDRIVCVGAAWDDKLIFEREWLLPAGLSADKMSRDFIRYLADALQLATEQDLPPHRVGRMRAASAAVRELAGC